MKYSANIDFKLDDMFDLYYAEFGHKLNNPDLYRADERIMPVASGFLVTGKNISWPVQSLIKQLGLTLETARLFITNPNMKLPIHRDCISKTRQLRQWAINIPIVNCDRGTNEWFDNYDNDFGKEVYGPDGAAIFPQWIDKEYKVSESCVLNQIKIIRTDVMHRSNNRGNDDKRAVLSLRCSDDITYKQVIERIS